MKSPRFLIGLLLGTLLAAAFWYWQKSTSAEDGALEVLDRLAEAEARVAALRAQEMKPQQTPEGPPQADDLRRIEGIGPTYAARLEGAGVTTFAALAALSPERLLQITQARSPETAVAWISAAAALSAG